MFKKLSCLSRPPNKYNKRISVFVKLSLLPSCFIYMNSLSVLLTCY